MLSANEKHYCRSYYPPIVDCVTILKSQKKFCVQEERIYHNIESFRYIQKCLKTPCKCQNSIQRKSMVILNHVYVKCMCMFMLNPTICASYTFYVGFPSYCMYHYILMNTLFEYTLCTDCLANNKICFMYSKELNNIRE